MMRGVLSVVVSTVILFVWSGMTQMLPWGITATQNVSTLPEGNEAFATPNQVRFAAGDIIGDAFEQQFTGEISTLLTPDTFSWIVTQPLREDYSVYFLQEVVTQLIVAVLLAALLLLTRPLALRTRLAIVAVVGIMASAATYGQLMNWWALPPQYGLGVSFNLVMGWLLAGFVSAKFIVGSTPTSYSEVR